MRTGTRIASGPAIVLFASILLAVSAGNGFAQKWLPITSSMKALAVPEPVRLKWNVTESFVLTAATVIVLPAGSTQEEQGAAAWLQQGLRNLYGVTPEIMLTDLVPEKNAILVGLSQNQVLRGLVSSLAASDFGKSPEQGYVLSANPNRTFLIGNSLQGLKYGIETLLQVVSMDTYIGMPVIPPLEIVDFPSASMRAFLLPLSSYRYGQQIWDSRGLIDMAEMLHMNTMIVQVDNAIKFDSAPEVGRTDALPRDSLRSLVAYARAEGFEVIPFIDTFSHQDALLCPTHPDLCLDKTTYDPSDPKVYSKLFGIIDEILQIFEPKYIHIGHDEIRAFSNMSKEKAADLFLSDIRKIHAHLKQKNVQMMMWAGMLLNAGQFPGQDNCNGFLGNTYALIDSMPRDIILVDTHYRQRRPDFPTTDYLLSKGFRVIGCVYNEPQVTDNFTKYVADKDGRFLGMSVALWNCYSYAGLGTPMKVLRDGAEAFWRGGVPPVDPAGKQIPPNLKRHPYINDPFEQ